MRSTPKSAITLKMYRHFAVLTLAVTAVIGFFARGENRQAIAERVADRQAESELAGATDEESGAPKFNRRESPPQAVAGTWGNDLGVRFGQPTMNVSSSAASLFTPHVEDWRQALVAPGSGNDYLAHLGAAERDELVQAMAANAGGSPEEIRAQIASAEAASRRRSGSAGLE